MAAPVITATTQAGSSFGSGTSISNVSISKPGSPVAGDTLVLIYQSYDDASPVCTCTGFTSKITIDGVFSGGELQGMGLLTRTVDGSEGSTFTPSFGHAGYNNVMMALITGGDATDSFDVGAVAKSSVASTTITYPTLTTSVNDCLLITIGAGFDFLPGAQATGTTQISASWLGSSGGAVKNGSKSQASSGSTGAISHTLTSDTWVCMLIVIKPAGGAPATNAPAGLASATIAALAPKAFVDVKPVATTISLAALAVKAFVDAKPPTGAIVLGALAPKPFVDAKPVAAALTLAARDPTVNTGGAATNAPAGLASLTIAALTATCLIAVKPAQGAMTIAALTPTLLLNATPQAGNAAFVIAALTPAIKVDAKPSVATFTITALTPTVQTGKQVAAPTATFTIGANQPKAAIAAQLANALITFLALNPTVNIAGLVIGGHATMTLVWRDASTRGDLIWRDPSFGNLIWRDEDTTGELTKA